jgi:hypothetical protein
MVVVIKPITFVLYSMLIHCIIFWLGLIRILLMFTLCVLDKVGIQITDYDILVNIRKRLLTGKILFFFRDRGGKREGEGQRGGGVGKFSLTFLLRLLFLEFDSD